jgi:hypothetical protein
MILPSIIPNLRIVSVQISPLGSDITHAVHICHIITNAPRIGAGEHSAAYTGLVIVSKGKSLLCWTTDTVVDFDPMPRPRTNRAMNRFGQLLATPSQTDATAATKQETKIVPRRPRYLFRGSVSQQPRTAQAKYGAPTIRPVRLSTVLWLSVPPLATETIPKCY